MFQANPNLIEWKIHLKATPDRVFKCLTESKHQQHYWAEKVIQDEQKLHYLFHQGIESRGAVLVCDRNRFYKVSYFGWEVAFTLSSVSIHTDKHISTDLVMRCEGVVQSDREEVIAGWVSWLMAFKAYVDFGIDLRNHDAERSWFTGFCDN